MEDEIEILPVTLLEGERSTVADLQRMAGRMKLEFGWHYLLDLTWIIRQLEDVVGKSMIDAGAGTGILQWYLANQGAKVFSVDRESRARLPRRFRRHFKVEGLREEDLARENVLVGGIAGIKQSSIKKTVSELIDVIQTSAIQQPDRRDADGIGQVIIYNQDLGNLVDIPANSVDAIVAVSSLEHNSPDGLEQVVTELMRVLKPGCAMYATLGAARDNDWFHAPSKGWCYSEGTLRNIFNLSPVTKSNYDQYDHLFEALQKNKELQENLAAFYFNSGDNGMPWGNWDPQYQPVGVRKIKREKLIGQ